jgi:2',3'-cyclic-nucleotide 2'-phosphodiesterase (5'-nucleotidase family)
MILLGFVLAAASVLSGQASAGEVAVTLLHTNDLHSHFRPDGGPLGLGGVARLKTAIDAERAKNPNTLLVDGGDWSEGDIYYIPGAGQETLKMMDHLGYDVAVVGNHDWLNGPDALLNAYQGSKARLGLVAANILADDYARAKELKRDVPPYVIKSVGGVKIAFVGLVTYEFIYDSFFLPVRIVPLKEAARAAAVEARLKGADAVVAISHNATARNLELLRDVPEIDLVIGAHDHRLWTRPQVQARLGARDGWVVEAGRWGQHLGRVDLKIRPLTEARATGLAAVELVDYRLTQIDARIPENADTAARVARLEKLVEGKVGPVFHDEVGESEIEIEAPSGSQDPLGTLNTDAYRAATGADFAIESRGFVYGELHPGKLRSVDIFRSNPGVYNPKTNKAWELAVLPIQGAKLKWLLNFVVTSGKSAGVGGLSASGLELVYALKDREAAPSSGEIGGTAGDGPGPGPRSNEFFALSSFLVSPFVPGDNSERISGLESITIGGQPLDPDKTYRFAMSGGVRSALDFVNLIMPGTVPMDGIRETGIEAWRAISDRVRAISPLTLANTQTGNRVRGTEAELGLYYDDIEAVPGGISVRVRNFGGADSAPQPGGLELLVNRVASDLTQDARFERLAPPQDLPAIAAGGETRVLFAGAKPPIVAPGLASVTARVGDVEQTRFFK